MKCFHTYQKCWHWTSVKCSLATHFISFPPKYSTYNPLRVTPALFHIVLVRGLSDIPALPCTPMVHLHGRLWLIRPWIFKSEWAYAGCSQVPSMYRSTDLNLCIWSRVRRGERLLALILWFFKRTTWWNEKTSSQTSNNGKLHENLTLRTVSLLIAPRRSDVSTLLPFLFFHFSQAWKLICKFFFQFSSFYAQIENAHKNGGMQTHFELIWHLDSPGTSAVPDMPGQMTPLCLLLVGVIWWHLVCPSRGLPTLNLSCRQNNLIHMWGRAWPLKVTLPLCLKQEWISW